MIKKRFYLLGVLIILGLFTSCTKKPISMTQLALGTTCRITIYEGEQNLDLYFDKINYYEHLFSRSIESSDVSRINKDAGIRWTKINKETYDLLEKAIQISYITEGAFNVAIGPLVDIWSNQVVPTNDEINNALKVIDYKLIKMKKEGSSYFVFLPKEGMQIDLGGIAKGYIAQQLGNMFEEGIINLGGNVFVKGRTENDPWKIGLQDPKLDRGEYFEIVRLNEGNVVTSGAYERYFIQDGVIYHHILDSATGWPSQGNVESVSIIGEDGTICDALSTAFFVLGPDKAEKILLEYKNYKCVFMLDNKEIVKLE